MKFDELPKADREGRPFELENAVVENVSIANDEHGGLTAWLRSGDQSDWIVVVDCHI